MKFISLQKILWAFALVLTTTYNANSQAFSTFNTSIAGFAQGGCDWGDYDKDGYVDVVLSGILPNNQPGTKLFKNNAGTFSEVNTGIAELKNGTVRFGDYDNDNDLDILVCGQNSNFEAFTLIYRNDNGSFAKMNHGFFGVYNGVAVFGDYDNDGFLDVLVTGDSLSYTPVTELYKNNGDNTFSVVNQQFVPLISSSATFGDYDNDGDNDILLCGDYSGMYVSKLYRNDNGIFAEAPVQFEGLGAGNAVFIDFDKDNDNDLFMLGNDMTLTPNFKIYRNDGLNIFTEVSAGVTGLALGNLAVADYNNDGYPDFAATGKAAGCGATATFIYFNNQQGSFWQEAVSLQSMSYSRVAWGDMDNDGDPDLLLMGANSSGNSETIVYRNNSGINSFVAHQSPPVPDGMQTTVDGDRVTFSWNRPVTVPPQSISLTYNLRIGINPGKMEVMAPYVNLQSGYSKLPVTGNTSCDTSWTIGNLREGEYFWSVQAVDHSFGTSAFSTEGSFTIELTGQLEPNTADVSVYPNPFTNQLNIRTVDIGAEVSKISLINAAGQIVLETETTGSLLTLNTARLSKGLYILRVTNQKHEYTYSLICKD
jgi:hypothetical protein